MRSLPAAWSVRDRALPLTRPLVVGILNVTPDSFSDGGRYATMSAALAQVEVMRVEGADVIDVGGESTRPHASPVDGREERDRVVPIVAAIASRFPDAVVSVDTVKAAVAEAALDAGAHAVNDVSGGRLDPRMHAVVARARAGYVAMHSRGDVGVMGTYALAEYGDDPAAEMLAELRERVDAALAAGIRPEALAVDPGVGFAKRGPDSIAALGALPQLVGWGFPVLVGLSRKRFVGELSGEPVASRRVYGTVGGNVAALALGARLFRVHDVQASRQALDVAWAVLRAADSARASLESVT